jgi:hypothetical protein
MHRIGASQVALKVGSGAAQACEPRQGRKAATVNSHLWVPSGRLAGAGWLANGGVWVSTRGARPLFSRVAPGSRSIG